MFSTQPLSGVPNRKGFSLIDVLTVGLMLIVLAAISMPLFHSAARSAPKQVTGPAAARTAPIKTASADGFTTASACLTTA